MEEAVLLMMLLQQQCVPGWDLVPRAAWHRHNDGGEEEAVVVAPYGEHDGEFGNDDVVAAEAHA